MQNSRRVARELALKVLFQVDVGKQPLAEVLEGAIGQIRTTLNSGVNQAAQEAQSALKSLAAERIDALGDKISAQSSRQIKAIATSMSTELRKLAERATDIGRDLCTHAEEGAAEAASATLHEAAEQTLSANQKLASRTSNYPDVLAQLAEAAAQKVDQLEAAFAKHALPAEMTASFMLRMVHGTTEKRDEIDRRLAERSTGWALDRQAAVDRNIMRLAAYEILYVPDIPAGASINEAVELAKKYSTAESGRFVNGVLGGLTEEK